MEERAKCDGHYANMVELQSPSTSIFPTDVLTSHVFVRAQTGGDVPQGGVFAKSYQGTATPPHSENATPGDFTALRDMGGGLYQGCVPAPHGAAPNYQFFRIKVVAYWRNPIGMPPWKTEKDDQGYYAGLTTNRPCPPP